MVVKLLNFLATNQYTKIQNSGNEIQLSFHSDTSCLSVSKVSSRSGEIYLLDEGPSNLQEIINLPQLIMGSYMWFVKSCAIQLHQLLRRNMVLYSFIHKRQCLSTHLSLKRSESTIQLQSKWTIPQW